MEIELAVSMGTLGKATVRGKDVKEVLDALAFFSGLPHVCLKCQSPLHFFHRQPQNFDYYGLVCDNGHEATFGQLKDGSGFFFKEAEGFKEPYIP